MLLAAAAPAVAADDPPTPLREGYPPAISGLIYKAAANVIIYVETDGRHIAAISPDGKLLWRKDPFVDAKMQPYRLARPSIIAIGPGFTVPGVGTSDELFSVSFNSSQSGVMNIATGKFTFMGQN